MINREITVNNLHLKGTFFAALEDKLKVHIRKKENQKLRFYYNETEWSYTYKELGYTPLLNDTVNLIKNLENGSKKDPIKIDVLYQIDDTETRKIFDKLYKSTYKSPQNAYIYKANGRIYTKDAVDGKELSYDKFILFIKKPADLNKDLGNFIVAIKPEIDNEVLKRLLPTRNHIFVTYFNSGVYNRANNIRRAIAILNNTIIQPGDVFSFNKTVGRRSADRGFRVAPVYINGKVSEGVGGGICQVSTTLYNAAAKAGLKIKERHPHSLPVHYVPFGRDATVSWGGPDFKFKNNTNRYVFINASVSGGTLKINVRN